MAQYGLAQAKARLSELTGYVDRGLEVVIARHGKPSYRLVPVDAAPASPPRQGLEDMSAFLADIRARCKPEASPQGFVAEWRKDARY